MKFDIFGRKALEVIRSNDQWLTFYCGNGGVKRKADDIRTPASLEASELDEYIADVFHEWATLERNEAKRLQKSGSPLPQFGGRQSHSKFRPVSRTAFRSASAGGLNRPVKL